MSLNGPTSGCPTCGSRHLVSITLPVPAAGHVAKPTRRAHRCLECGNQWPTGAVEELVSASDGRDAPTTSTEQ